MDRSAELARALGLLQASATRGVDAHAALLANVRARLFQVAPRVQVFGRYHVRGPLGAGGVGVVLRAHDPQLDREIAIKLVRETTDDAAQQRLLREARAIARLAHPNVVAVYDVGRVDGVAPGLGVARHGVWVVMELVEGEDLAQWSSTPRSVQEILDVYLAAGRGLAAAHAQGLLHRDFKPHNVLLGRDGRVRVADFGLSLGRRVAVPDSGDPIEASLTAPGIVVGTPLYMSPEQHDGAEVDPRSDQYSYCFALREALWGRPPFRDLASLRALKARAPVLPPRRDVSRRIARALERGLQPDPAARWPSMDALLLALAEARRPDRHRGWLAGAAIAGAIGLATRAGAHDRSGPCAGDDPGWSEVWGTSAREAVAAAFERGAPAVAAAAIAGVDETLSARGVAWTTTRDRVCATEPPAVALACLVHARAQAEALVQLWREGDPETTTHAVEAVATIEDPNECDPSQSDALARPIAAVSNDAELLALEALMSSGRIADAARSARSIAPRLPAMPSGVAARAGLLVGAALGAAGEDARAEQILSRAYDDAQAVDDHVASVRVAARLVSVVGMHLDRPDDADLWARHAWAALTRAGDPPGLRAEVDLHLGNLAAARGRWDQALEHYLANAAAIEQTSGADSLAHARALENVANARTHQGDDEGAIAVLQRSLALELTRLGADHPDVAVTRHNLAVALHQRGELVGAEAQCRQALAGFRAAHGERHPDVALARYTLGSILYSAGEGEAAVVELGAALELRRALLGPEHSDVLGTMNNLATALDATGRAPEAQDVLEQIVRIQDRPGAVHSDRGIVLLNLGNILRRGGDVDGARRIHLRAIDALTTDLGADHHVTAIAWYSLANDTRLLGDLDGAAREIATAVSRLGRVLPPDHGLWVGVLQEQGRIAAARGELDAARTAFTSALELRAANPHVEESEAELRADLAALGGGR